MACGSAAIETTPVFPVLVDGALMHTTAFGGPQTFTVTLPANMTCTRCTLQVEEFMSSHALNNPGGCFYHHCADISIQAADGGSTGVGGSAGNDASTTPTPSNSSGCSLAARGAPRDAAGAVALSLLAIAARRRRRPGA